MKILITVGHPAHVHYFSHSAQELIKRGHVILFFVRDRECIVDLMENSGFNYTCYGKGGSSFIAKFLNIAVVDFKLLRQALSFKPDILLSFASPYASHVSSIIRKPHIAFDDTEHAKLEHMLYRPFTDVIISPYVYDAKLHKRQILIKTFMELFYLDDKHFTPNKHVLTELGVDQDAKYCVLRFVAWNANHDVGYKGLSYDDKIRIVKSIAEHYNVFISSEGALPQELESYRLRTHPSQFHSVMKYASVCISEGSTTASESAVLGTPTIYVNPLRATNCDEEQKYGLLFQNLSTQQIIDKSLEILNMSDSNHFFEDKRCELHSEMIDGTEFLTWFIENYPESNKMMKENPDCPYRFK